MVLETTFAVLASVIAGIAANVVAVFLKKRVSHQKRRVTIRLPDGVVKELKNLDMMNSEGIEKLLRDAVGEYEKGKEPNKAIDADEE